MNLIFTLLLAVQVAGQPAKPTELEGAWEATHAMQEGRTRDLPAGQTRLAFRGDMLLAVGFIGGPNPGEEKKLRFKVDVQASPKRLDIVESHRNTIEAIYEVSGEALKIVVPTRLASRPVNFDAGTGSGIIVLILKRTAK